VHVNMPVMPLATLNSSQGYQTTSWCYAFQHRDFCLWISTEPMALHCCAGGISSSDPPANPVSWLSDKSWVELVHLSSDIKGFEGLEEAFRSQEAAFKVRHMQ